MRYLLTLLLLAASMASAEPVRFELSGYITRLFPGVPEYEDDIRLGQSVFGWYEVDWGNTTELQVPYPGMDPQARVLPASVSYYLDIGSMQLVSTYSVDLTLRDGGPGIGDSLGFWDPIPRTISSDLIFDDLLFSLVDPTGTGYGLTETTLDLDQFIVGHLAFYQHPFSGYWGFEAIIAARRVPEPGTFLLFLTAIVPFAAFRRRAQARR